MQDQRKDPIFYDPQTVRPQDLEGDTAVDSNGPPTADGGLAGDGIDRNDGGIDLVNEATTADGGIAIDGGKLPGNKDDFEHELDGGRIKPVPGADPNNGVHPPNSRDLRQ